MTTIEELDDLISDPQLLRIQAILFLYRILHRTQTIPSLYFLHFFSKFLVSKPNMKTVDKMEQICDVDAMLFILESYNEQGWETRGTFQFVSAAFLHLFSVLEELPKHLLPLESLLKFLCLLSSCSSERKPFVTYLLSRYPMLNILIEILYDNWPISRENKRCLSHYIPRINVDHYIMGRLYGGFNNKDKLIEMIELLVESGANPYATVIYQVSPNLYRYDGDTPLHILLIKCNCNVTPEMIARIKLLVEAGAHLDQLNSIGQSPLSIFKLLERKRAEKKLAAIPELQHLFYSVLPLKCYASQTVAKHILEYPQSVACDLPRSIISFINFH